MEDELSMTPEALSTTRNGLNDLGRIRFCEVFGSVFGVDLVDFKEVKVVFGSTVPSMIRTLSQPAARFRSTRRRGRRRSSRRNPRVFGRTLTTNFTIQVSSIRLCVHIPSRPFFARRRSTFATVRPVRSLFPPSSSLFLYRINTSHHVGQRTHEDGGASLPEQRLLVPQKVRTSIRGRYDPRTPGLPVRS